MRIALCLFLLLVPTLLFGQSAELGGYVKDPSGAVVPNATVELRNQDTGVRQQATANGDGVYRFVGIKPGAYQATVQAQGFMTLTRDAIVLNVADRASMDFSLQVGSTEQTVNVTAEVPLVNTTDGSVSTMVDRNFVENLPMNGRSFQTLIQLTPGVVLTQTSVSEQGQFSVNGQRADANYFTVDGVSVNAGASGAFALVQTAGGALPAFSAQGGTTSLVSVDAMQEFRVQTSSFAPEFGRTPGGQVSITTRSGTNDFHGTLFDYLRNDVLDANDWFANHSGLSKPKERQNDFGGVLSGPIFKNKTFFFFSYEGSRLRQPQTQITTVPNTASRQAAPAAVQPFLNAFPRQNGPDLSNGFAQFAATYSDSATVDAYSVRVDHAFSSKLDLFARYSYTPSKAATRVPSILSDTAVAFVNTHTFTLGLTESITPHVTNEVRANYTNVKAGSRFNLDNFGGAVPFQDSAAFPSGFSSENSLFGFGFSGTPSLLNLGKNTTNEQRQFNLVDNLSMTAGVHQLKLGVDYRWLAPISSPRPYDQSVFFSGMSGPTGALSGLAASASVAAFQNAAFLSQNISLYGQDTWRVSPRLTLTYGLRWDVNPPLKGKNSDSDPFSAQGLDTPATMTLAPHGTPLYETTYGNVAPRLGMAYQLRQNQKWSSVLRGGFGLFYDLGLGSLGNLNGGFPFAARRNLAGVPFPLTAQQAAPPAFSVNPPVSNIFVADRSLKLPRTYQWNASVEQSLGANQSASLTYVGAIGRKLLRQDALLTPNPNFTGVVDVTRNTATSDYHALQLKFQRRLSRGLQALASYSWSHSIDIASNDSFTLNSAAAAASAALDRGDSDFDVRHSFAAALTYDLPSPGSQEVAKTILGGWSVDTLVIARSALPVNVSGPVVIAAGTQFVARPNIVAGVPFYLYSSAFPGGKQLNKAAFTNPPAGQQGNLRRNALREFGAWQDNFVVRRQFHVTEKVKLQFRAEFFNLFNHPNFGNPAPANLFLSSGLFGQSTQTLASSLGRGGISGGLTPLYQVGGPRSLQFALKLQF